MEENHIKVFTDGASRGNPGPGGWAVICLLGEGKVIELGGHDPQTTNNRMELSAVLEAFRFLSKRAQSGQEITLYSDSAYVLNGLGAWIYGWQKNGWLTKTGEPVANDDLWREILTLMLSLKLAHEINFEKVSGHAGVIGNERADVIATGFADGAPPLLFTGSLGDYMKFAGAGIFETRANTEKHKTRTRKAYAYVSKVNGEIFIDTTWAACEKRVRGAKGAQYKKVFSKEEQENLISEWRT